MTSIPVMKPWLGAEEAQAAADAVASGWVAKGPGWPPSRRRSPRGSAPVDAVAASLVHHRAAPGAARARRRARRRGRRAVAVVHRHRQRGPATSGATPVFADVELATQNVTADDHRGGDDAGDQGRHRRPPGRRTRRHGRDPRASATPLGIAVIEDAACAIGATYRGPLDRCRLRPGRVLLPPAQGDHHRRGRACSPPRRRTWATALRRLREHGMSVERGRAAHRRARRSSSSTSRPGFNYRMTDIQAAVGLVQLAQARRDRRPAPRARRRATRTSSATFPGAVLAADPPYGTTNFQSFWVLLPERPRVGRATSCWRALLAQGHLGAAGHHGVAPRARLRRSRPMPTCR